MILHQQNPACLEHTRALAHKSGRVQEMVRRDAARHKVERLTLKRQGFGIGQLKHHIVDSIPADNIHSLCQHPWRDIRRDYLRNKRRKPESRVPPSGRHVKHNPIRLRLGECDQAI